MVKRFNFNNLSKQEIDELIDNMYNHYYYIVDSTYIKHHGEINKDDIIQCLKLGINDYFNNQNNNPSS